MVVCSVWFLFLFYAIPGAAFPLFAASRASLFSSTFWATRSSYALRSSQFSLAFFRNLKNPNIPKRLFQNPIKKDRMLKNFPLLVVADLMALICNTRSPSSGAWAGTVSTHGRTHLPFIIHSHVPHSPFPQPYWIYCPACEATSRMGWPAQAMLVLVVLPWRNNTGIVPFRPTPVYPSFLVSPAESARVPFLTHFGT